MLVFSEESNVEAWGPLASATVRIKPFGDIIDDTWILVNFSMGAHEITDIRQCFNDVSYIYALGNSQSSCAISLKFAIMIGNRNCRPGFSENGNTYAILAGMKEYVAQRISTDKGINPSTITIGDFSVQGWLRGIDIGQADPMRGICYGTLNYIMNLRSLG